MNEVASINEGRILYYPTIEFLDDIYVSRALCIWDKIYRIVPKDVQPYDSSLVKHVISAGLIENVVLSNKELRDTAKEFMDFIERLDFVPDQLDTDRTTMLHLDKIEKCMQPYMKTLAKSIEGKWLHISERLVNGYMLFLANSISRNRGISKMTDNEDVYAAMSYFDSNANLCEYVYDDLKSDYYSLLTIPAVIPDGAMRVDIDNILKFRERTISERNEFRSRVIKFAEDLTTIENKDHAHDILKEFNRNIDESKNNIIERSSSFIKGFTKSILAVGVPTTISTLGLFGSTNPFTPVHLGQGAAVGAIAALSNTASNSKFDSKSASYFHTMQDFLGDEYGYVIGNTPRFSSRINEFIND